MKPEHIEKIIDGLKELGQVAIGAAAFVISVHTIVTQLAFGRAAIRKLTEEHAAMKKELDELKKDQIDQSEEIRDIKSQYEKIIERILNKLRLNQ